MSVATPVSIEAAERFARQLRENPELAMRSAEDLAREFDLDRTFVQMVLQGAPGRSPELDGDPWGRRVAGGVRSGSRMMRDLWRRATARPIPFIGVTALACTLVVIAIISASRESGAGRAFVLRPEGWGLLGLAALFGTPILHYLALFRHGRVRWALYGGLACWLIATPVTMVAVWLAVRDGASVMTDMMLVGAGMFVLVSIHTGVGSLAAVLGGFVQMRREERRERHLTRQQLLDRRFEIQRRLEGATNSVDPPSGIGQLPVVRAFQRHPYLYSVGIGFATGTIALASIVHVYQFRPTGDGRLSPAAIVVSLALSALNILTLVGVGFFAGGLRKAFVAVSLVFAASAAPMLAFGRPLDAPGHPTAMAFNYFLALVIGGFSSIGAKVEERAARMYRIHHEDPAALLAEKVRIEWMLSPSARSVCVMVVDAAKSSLMKAEEHDPLVVEWTFRDYQRFIEDVSSRYNGRVHSTAGDGAVVAFHSVIEAFNAARAIQTEVEEFNRTRNRLKSPFRLRIGLHSGEIVAELSKVEYTSVIDIAAHIEAAAPVGGIALTAEVAAELEGERLAELKDEVDGFQVFVALNPTRLGQ